MSEGDRRKRRCVFLMIPQLASLANIKRANIKLNKTMNAKKPLDLGHLSCIYIFIYFISYHTPILMQEQEQLSIDLPAVPEMPLTLPRAPPCNVKNSKCVPCCGPDIPFYLQCRTNCGTALDSLLRT